MADLGNWVLKLSMQPFRARRFSQSAVCRTSACQRHIGLPLLRGLRGISVLVFRHICATTHLGAGTTTDASPAGRANQRSQYTSFFILEPVEQPIKNSNSWLTLINSHSIVAHVTVPPRCESSYTNNILRMQCCRSTWARCLGQGDCNFRFGWFASTSILTRHVASLGRGLVANAEPHSLPKGMGINGNW